MTCNVGGVERTIRILVGVGLLLLAFLALEGTARWVVGVIAVVPLATGIAKFCPLWSLLGINTCRVKT
ncbi:MAG: DUF2892 domain-containing protein [Acidobacteria bacterium]|nr:DUF2892 domain-containing protein [Acidobacteriota bacterium]MDW7985335.1 DUF2892 domain-containing protein [Acidobacteriota bacterium]